MAFQPNNDMKTLLFLVLFVWTSVSANAQTFDEWFRQEQTQEKYLVQQIAALQAYSGTLRQGYEIARLGISTVQQIKNGDLALHQVFFQSLRQVNPLIRHSGLAQDIFALQLTTGQALTAKDYSSTTPGLLTLAEQDYLQQVKGKILEACLRDMERLWLLLRADVLEMPDHSRLQQLEALHRSTLDNYRFTQSFLKEMQLLAMRGAKELRDLENMQTIFHNP